MLFIIHVMFQKVDYLTQGLFCKHWKFAHQSSLQPQFVWICWKEAFCWKCTVQLWIEARFIFHQQRNILTKQGKHKVSEPKQTLSRLWPQGATANLGLQVIVVNSPVPAGSHDACGRDAWGPRRCFLWVWWTVQVKAWHVMNMWAGKSVWCWQKVPIQEYFESATWTASLRRYMWQRRGGKGFGHTTHVTNTHLHCIKREAWLLSPDQLFKNKIKADMWYQLTRSQMDAGVFAWIDASVGSAKLLAVSKQKMKSQMTFQHKSESKFCILSVDLDWCLLFCHQQ